MTPPLTPDPFLIFFQADTGATGCWSEGVLDFLLELISKKLDTSTSDDAKVCVCA